MKPAVKNNHGRHTWRFSRIGGVNRVNLERGADLINLPNLDQKLWTALSCPVYGLEIDSKTLELIDTDNDGRIRVPEILEAVKWVTSLIKNPDELTSEGNGLPLLSINDSTSDGRNLLESARQILTNLGKTGTEIISVADTSDTIQIFANTRFNGDGIITEFSTDDENLKILINEIISCVGSVADRNGKPGISGDHVNLFYKECRDFSEWNSKAEADLKNVMPFGDSTPEALASFMKVKNKISDYFIRCRLSEYNPDSSGVLNSLGSKFEEIRLKDLSAIKEEIAALPLAVISNDNTLPLTKGLNPSWEDDIRKFRDLVVNVVFPGSDKLTISDIETIEKRFDTYNKWISEKAGIAVSALPLGRVRKILTGKGEEELQSLIADDLAMEKKANNIILVDKLVRFYRDIFTLLRNYVTFHDFYTPEKDSIFQAGRLYIDQRCCDLCLRVTDMPKHNTLASKSGLCLLYCECTSKKINEKMTIVAALTDGDVDNIEVGRNGVFYDRKGNDWDATIIKIVDNPISIRQAFWMPYRRFSRFISNQVEKFAASKDKEVEAATATGVEKTSGKVESGLKESVAAPAAKPPAPAPPPFDIGKFAGIFAALSIAIGAIGSFITSIVTGFMTLTWWKIPLAIIGIMLIISGPAMILAWLKLRKRNLAPVLDANGWAVNARATINIIFGKTLTHLAVLPEGAKLNLLDPFAKKKRPIIPIILIIIAVLAVAAWLLWHFGLLVKWGII